MLECPTTTAAPVPEDARNFRGARQLLVRVVCPRACGSDSCACDLPLFFFCSGTFVQVAVELVERWPAALSKLLRARALL